MLGNAAIRSFTYGPKCETERCDNPFCGAVRKSLSAHPGVPSAIPTPDTDLWEIRAMDFLSSN